MTVNVSIFFQSSGMTPSRVYYSNNINAALLPLRAILHLWKNFKCNTEGCETWPLIMSVLYQSSDLTKP